MDTSSQQLSSSLTCELKILRAKNTEFVPAGSLFVRYYLISGDGKRIRLNSREIPSTSGPYWNDFISLDCGGVTDAAEELGKQSVLFELRWRSNKRVLGTVPKSKLLGRTEIEWRYVLESTNMSMQRWVSLSTVNSSFSDLKPPSLEIGMEIRIPKEGEKVNKRSISSKKWPECGCRHCDYCRDEDLFAIVAALDMVL